jgi:hypothetical protein
MKIITKLSGEAREQPREIPTDCPANLRGGPVQGPDGIVRYLSIHAGRVSLHHGDRAVVIPFSVLLDFAKSIDPKFAELPQETGLKEVQEETTQRLQPGINSPRPSPGDFGNRLGRF